MDHDNEWVAKTLTSTQKLHYVAPCFARDPTKLHIRNLFCLCAFCLDEDYENYISSQHVGDWCIHLLVPTNPTYIQSFTKVANDEVEWEHGGNKEYIVQLVEIGDNFVIKATLGNEEDYEFYVACCKKPIFEVNVDGLSDDWGNSFEPRSIVIGSCHYQRWGCE